MNQVVRIMSYIVPLSIVNRPRLMETGEISEILLTEEKNERTGQVVVSGYAASETVAKQRTMVAKNNIFYKDFFSSFEKRR